MQKLLGFVPDADPTTPGVLVECVNLIPYTNGMMGAPTGQTPTDVEPLTSECRGAVVVSKLDASRRIFAGTQTKLYERLDKPFTRASTGTYFDVAGVMQTAAIDVLRTDYDPITHVSNGSLIESAATNLLTYSSGFDNAAWTKSSVTVTANSVVAPDGTTTADLLTPGAADSTVFQNVAVGAEVDVSFTVYMYASSAQTLSIVMLYSDASNDNQSCSVTTGWNRFTVSGTTPVGNTSVSAYIGGFSTFSTGENVYAWGAQLEESATPTSYIPTTTVAVTRAADIPFSTWTDRSKSGGYVGGTDSRWSFTQFGDTTLAANGVEAIQESSSGAFATIATAPIAEIIFSVGSFVMALNTIDGTYGTQTDRWWCSATYDATDWTPSLTTLSTTGRLVSAPGPILAGGRLGEYAVVYKQKAIYIGQYVGAPEVWSFTQVPGGEAGCVGKDAWCDVGSAHVFVGNDNIYAFDGTRPVAIGTGEVRDWFFANVAPNYLYKIKMVFDRKTNAVWIFYPSFTSTVCDQVLVHHLGTKQWGCATVSVEAALDYIASGTTIDGLDSVSATIDGLSAYSFDSQYWLSGGRALSIVNSSHQLQLMTGNTVTSGATTGDVGDDEAVTLLSKLRVRFAPGYVPTATVQMFSKMTEGAGLTTGPSGALADGKFDVLQSARFHRMALSFTGPVKVLSVGAETQVQGNA